MSRDYASGDYDTYRRWINITRSKGKSWEDIECRPVGDQSLEQFLKSQHDTNYWEIDVEDWKELVSLQKAAENKKKQIRMVTESALLVGDGEDGDFTIPMDRRSSWQLYRRKLVKEIGDDAVTAIEDSNIRILNRLHRHTEPDKAVKGLVIGDVQSGKTANTAGLMAMAADWGWNMFIVFSGTIETLREQTQSRLFDYLNEVGNLHWTSLEHLSLQSPRGSRAQDLHFEKYNDDRYFTVCLKNPKRLEDLLRWLSADDNKRRQMKILVIDDEADQAGINTSTVSEDEAQTERSRINQLLTFLVNGQDEKGVKQSSYYDAMNYIGYTATPYANILNEKGRESLYPRSFISALGVSKEYFGPQQIFGVANGDYEGLDIVREIGNDDLQEIKSIHKEESCEIPYSLKQAICWFIDGVACRRLQRAHKPVSMLIHTSQATGHHQAVADAITKWFEQTPKAQVRKMCQEVWKTETTRFSLAKFKEQYRDYSNKETVQNYPPFDDIKPFVEQLLNIKLTHISLGDDGKFEYGDGIHLCVDNCKNNGINEDGFYMRLAYPEKKEDLERTPAFIVIGGQTLSRGLTLNGLISSYFLRSVGQADTLMQMGRWFGYRKGYELLNRIWLTAKTKKQFEFLSNLDQELRDEIYNMNITGKIPADYGPRVKNTPSYSFIRITAKNKMQSAQLTEVDYSGAFMQTYLFDENIDIIHSNFKATMDLLRNLGTCDAPDPNNRYARGTKIWRNIDFSTIENYLQTYQVQKNQHLAGTMNDLLEWIRQITNEGKLGRWHVVLSDAADTNAMVNTPVGQIHLVTRTRKIKDESWKGVIDIGVLRNPRHLISDIDISRLPAGVRDQLDKYKTGQIRSYRDEAGLANIPLLILYLVNKNSKASSGSTTRIDLCAPDHIAGYCLNIPGGQQGQNYAKTISIHMDHDVFDGESDLEE